MYPVTPVLRFRTRSAYATLNNVLRLEHTTHKKTLTMLGYFKNQQLDKFARERGLEDSSPEERGSIINAS